jgi:hypothetical protein
VLQHGRIVETYGFGVFSDGLPFVVTEHLAGAPLRQGSMRTHCRSSRRTWLSSTPAAGTSA